MPERLRDRLAAVLGPGNNDQTAYAQADAVLEILLDEGIIDPIDYPVRHASDGPSPERLKLAAEIHAAFRKGLDGRKAR